MNRYTVDLEHVMQLPQRDRKKALKVIIYKKECGFHLVVKRNEFDAAHFEFVNVKRNFSSFRRRKRKKLVDMWLN